MARLNARFFARSPLEVAPDLLGCLLVHVLPNGTRLVGRLVEVEAYLGSSDPGSHAYRGPTARTRAMFGPAGRLYVYRSMGLHTCVNVVCGPDRSAGAVLLRAAEPLEGLRVMQARRGRDASRDLASGPGKLSQAFGITLGDYGRGVTRGSLRIEPAPAGPKASFLVSPRIGLSRGADLPYRFFVERCPHVTRSPLNRRAQAAGAGPDYP